ncbi:MAG: LacI family DNA-binding transcriptional regulator [Anaerolineales bacterium]
MPLTLEDIARFSGFSRSTVSRVINGGDYVKEDTRQRILEVIQEHNFQPNLGARSLAGGQTGVLGLVIQAAVSTIFSDLFFPQFIRGVSAGCNTQNYSMMLWLVEPQYERRTMREILYNGLLDGVIISSVTMNDPLFESLHDSKMPFISIGRHPTLDDINYLDVDNVKSASTVVHHLFNLGRKRIATITGPQNKIAGYDRYTGYMKGLKECGLPMLSDLVVDADFTEEGGYNAMQQLIPFKPDAIFAASDTMAIGALRALSETNLRVPEDIAIVGYDDVPLASRTSPPLTTVRQSLQDMGAAAVKALADIIRRPGGKPQHIILDTELVIRGSCGGMAKD